MKQLLNTLFVTSEDIYLSLDGENVLANRDKEVIARYPSPIPAPLPPSWASAPKRESVWPSVHPGDGSLPGSAGKPAGTYFFVGSSTGLPTIRHAAVKLLEP